MLSALLGLVGGCSDEQRAPLLPARPIVLAATQTPVPVAGPAIDVVAPDVPAFQETGDWALPHGGQRATRARDSEIQSSTVERLDVAWTMPIWGFGPYGYAAGAPVVVEETVYLQDLGSNLYAVDLESGELIWEAAGVAPVAGPNGPAVADGRVFASRGASTLSALDAGSGELLWTVGLEKDGFQPTVFGDAVLVGTGNFAHVPGNSGFVHAFDAATGEALWSFQVVEEGFWGDPTENSGGGVWYAPSIDERRGLIYFGTGNAGPYPGTRFYPNATSRPGDNLYTSSMVALSAADGEVAWYHQVVTHGLFDHDFQLSPMLVTVATSEGERELTIGAGKAGRVVAVEADTGEMVWDTPVGIHQNDDLAELPLGALVEVYPGVYGGVETPMAFAGGLVFAPVVNAPTTHSATGHGAADGSSALVNASARTSLGGATGELVALDAATGAVVWTVEFDSPLFGGATAVGDLVFTGTYAGEIIAVRQADGVEVWRYQTGGGINSWPAVQGDTIVWAIGLGVPRLLALRLVAD